MFRKQRLKPLCRAGEIVRIRGTADISIPVLCSVCKGKRSVNGVVCPYCEGIGVVFRQVKVRKDQVYIVLDVIQRENIFNDDKLEIIYVMKRIDKFEDAPNYEDSVCYEHDELKEKLVENYGHWRDEYANFPGLQKILERIS